MGVKLSENGLRPSPIKNEVVYTATNIWDVKIQTFQDRTSYLSTAPSGFEEHRDFNSLEELTMHVYNERKDKHGPPKLSKDNPMSQKCNIAHSATPRYDIIARPILSAPVAKNIGIQQDARELQVQHVLLKNGLNNASFIAADGTRVELTSAIAGSSDRESDKLSMARKVAPFIDGQTTQEAPSYCYTGRPDTHEKALEQAQMIFFSEIESTHSKGVKEIQSEDSETIYEMTYVVNSLQSNSPLYGTARLFRGKAQAPEHILFHQEQLALNEIKNKIHTFERNGKQYRVKLKPILFSRQVNIFANLEKTLDSTISGEKAALKASRQGWKELKALAEAKLDSLNEEDKPLARQLIDRLERSHNGRWVGAQDGAVEELLCRAMLILLLDLPVVYHCKSSIDRTSIFVALHVSLAQWRSLGLTVDKEGDFTTLIDNPNFKEIFALNWVQGHQISRNARSAEGVIKDGDKTVEIDGEIITLYAGKGLDECPALAKLLPEWYLKAYGPAGFFLADNPKDKIKNWLIYLGTMTMSALTLPFLTLLNPNGTLRTPESLPAHVLLSIVRYPLMLLKNYFRLFFNFHKAIPEKVINVESAEVGKRHLVQATSAHQKPFIAPLEAVPANAKTIKEYDNLFAQRFNQISRSPLRHAINGNGFNPKDRIAPAHQFLSSILDAPKLEIRLMTKFISEETNDEKKTITFIHRHIVGKEDRNCPVKHFIRSTTILNNDPENPDYGKGVIEYHLSQG